MWPLYAAGFTTAFAAHAVAANLGGVTSLLVLGGLLALYDGAEVLLKPVFGNLADRVGARPVLLGGLAGFALASTVFVVAGSPGWLWAARLGQGAAAAAFSPAASALAARLTPAARSATRSGRCSAGS
jgi:MFS family permease